MFCKKNLNISFFSANDSRKNAGRFLHLLTLKQSSQGPSLQNILRFIVRLSQVYCKIVLQ